ncbi:MAG: hypothetical protein RLP44_09085 [Aggregatilineales bacterium]
MSDDHFDPDSLADYLDSLFDGADLPTNADDPLVDMALRLSNAPKPELDPARFELIRDQVLKANQANLNAGNVGASSASSLSITTIIGVVAILIVSIVIGIYVVTQNNDASNDLTVPETTPDVTHEVIVTDEATEESTPDEIATTEATPGAELILSDTPTDEPTATHTAAATLQVAPEITEESTPEPTTTESPTATATLTQPPTATETPEPSALPITLIIEGAVQEIVGNILIIYDFEIEVDPNDPILTIIQVGDVIRIDGTMEIITNTEDIRSSIIRITPTIIVSVGDTVQINADTGEVWRDDNSCNNPPPAWAPANGWRARCEGATAPGNSGNAPGQGGSNRGSGRGRGSRGS